MTTPPRYIPSTCEHPVCDKDPILCPGEVMCEPQPLPVFEDIDLAVIIVFIVEYAVRFFLCWAVPPECVHMLIHYSFYSNCVTCSPSLALAMCRVNGITPYSWEPPGHRYLPWSGVAFPLNPGYSMIEFYIRYILTTRSVIDIVCILPGVVTLASGGGQSQSTFIRLLRVFRIFKLLMSNKRVTAIIGVIIESLNLSIEALILLVVASSMIGIFFGSLLLIIEKGSFEVTASYPDGYVVIYVLYGRSLLSSATLR